MKESAADIQNYLNIIQGNVDNDKEQVNEGVVNLGVATGGVEIGQTYSFENGLRWLRVLDESDQFWVVEHGYIEHEADTREILSKYDMAKMIRYGEMIYEEIIADALDDLFFESIDDSDEQEEFVQFMEKVDKYLLVNYQLESDYLDFDWKMAFENEQSPIQAAEEAIILKG